MSGVNLADATHEVIDAMSYELHTSRKHIVEKMFAFSIAHKEDFLAEMFEKKEEGVPSN